MTGAFDSIFKNRHPELKKKADNWNLIYNSYIGGVAFKEAGYLIQYPKESNHSFKIRKTRAVYFNQVSPIVDMLSGLLFMNKPTRVTPKEQNYLLTDISGDKHIDEFMRIVAAHTFLFTCAILVDAPNYDIATAPTEKDRKEQNLHPYATLYLPFRIRDFNINPSDGELDWIVLDNSYYDHSDPFKNGETVTRYTLWTRTGHQDFERRGLDGIITSVTDKEIPHNIGYVPVRLASWRDDNNDFVSETICEDMAMVSKLIYNNLSYMDEMLAAGTFKMLAYPSKDGGIPDELKAGGVGNLGIIPYNIESSNPPSFIGASLGDIDPFIKAITFYMTEILKKVGLSTDEQKEFVKSGAAKKIDFQKMRALLISGALMMSKLEEWIFKTAALWEGRPITSDLKVEYTSAFSDEDLETEVTMLTSLLVLPIKSLQKNATKLIVKKVMGNYLEPDVLEEINKDIDANLNMGTMESKSSSKIDLKAEAKRIKDAGGSSDTNPEQNTDKTKQGVTK